LVGYDDVATRKWALEKAQSHDQLFASLLHPALPVQHAIAILRFCAIPRMNYLTRVVRPDPLRPACEYFDRKVFETALTKLGLPSTLTDEARTLLTQPVRLGGFGLRPMVRVSPAAYWSSVSQAAPDIAALIQSRLVAPSPLVASPPPEATAPQPAPLASPAPLDASAAASALLPRSSSSSLSRYAVTPPFLQAASTLRLFR